MKVATADINDDGVDEIFFILTSNYTGNAPPSVDILQRDGEVWRHIGGYSGSVYITNKRSDGYRTLYTDDYILEWDGGEYGHIPNRDVEFYLSRGSDDGADTAISGDADDHGLGHLLRHVGTFEYDAVLADPEVRPRLEALLGSEFAYFLHNMLGGEKITLEDDHLVLQGTSIKPHLGDSADETAALVVRVADGALYVGLQWHGAVTIRGEAPSYDDLPAALRAWVAWWHGIRTLTGPAPPLRWVSRGGTFVRDEGAWRSADLAALLDMEGYARAATLLDDPRVQRLLEARLSPQAFSYSLRPPIA